jgi:ATP-dependent Clp protease ATP-binding subunit ClpC
MAETFERFTDTARRAIVLATEECRALDYERVGTEHLLLGLIREDRGKATRILAGVGLSAEAVRQWIVSHENGDHTAPEGYIPLAQDTIEVFDSVIAEATRTSRDYIATEHLLFGLLQLGDCAAIRILVGLGVMPSRLRKVLSAHV